MDGDFVELSDADQTTGWTGRAPFSNIGIDTASQIEGTGCIDARLQDGTGDATFNGSVTYTGGGISDLDFVNATSVITRTTGSWITDGFLVGEAIVVTGSVSNNGIKHVTAVTAGNLTVSETLTEELNVAATVRRLRNFTDKQVYSWFRPSSPVDTFANAGVTMRISGTVGGATNYGQWNVGGSDLGIVGEGGWINYTVDLLLPFDTTNGTPPLPDEVVDSGLGGTFLSGPGMAQPCLDRLVFGTTAIVRGGTGGAPGLWTEAATADLANGHIKEIAGAIFVNCRVRFGDSVGVTSTEFDDVDAVILFETNMLIAGDLAGFEFAGNSTGTNNATFGVASGAGVDKVGGSGGTWKAAGDRPFRVEAKDTNMDATGIFGVTMLGPSALWDDPVRNFKVDDGGAFTDDTRDFNDTGTGDVSPFPTPAVNDACYFGHNVRFYEINIDTGTAKSGTYTLVWEYYNGTSWASLTDVTDGTNGLTTTGPQTVTYAIPDDWAKTTVDTDNRYWIRLRVSAFTSSTTVPLIDEGSVALAGDIELEDSSAEMISCVLSSMGAVRVKNGAFCKKTTIASTIAPAKHAALDLGGADPTTDTVRDLTITNNTVGVLLKGSGNVTYNFRNFIFSGNTKDVRVDFGSGDTVTINILEGGTAIVIGDIDNVNGSTIDIINAKTVRVTVNDENGVALQNARVLLEAADGTGSLPYQDTVTITRSGATASVSHTTHGMKTGDEVIIRGADQQEYNGSFAITNVTTNAYDYTVSGAPTTPATGTIQATGAVFEGLTNVSGIIENTAFNYSVDQPITGFVRKSSTPTRYKSFRIDGTITTDGFSTQIRMVLDE